MISTIYAKERGAAPADDPHTLSTIAIYYDVAIPPPTPLHTGQKVRIISLIPCPTPPRQDGTDHPPHYTVREAGVIGTITAVRTMEETITEFAVRNENDQSAATYAYLAIQHIQGQTVQLSLWEAFLRRFVLQPLPQTRNIPLEADAVILRNIARLRPERERYASPNLRGNRLEEDIVVESETRLMRRTRRTLRGGDGDV
ncbi:hypothetical protein OH77DRAFT_1418310 [Trametes cingulata]|nr:hypothetical protein OH77DRAFT_1418310 [Trametes cingulata]